MSGKGEEQRLTQCRRQVLDVDKAFLAAHKLTLRFTLSPTILTFLLTVVFRSRTCLDNPPPPR